MRCVICNIQMGIGPATANDVIRSLQRADLFTCTLLLITYTYQHLKYIIQYVCIMQQPNNYLYVDNTPIWYNTVIIFGVETGVNTLENRTPHQTRLIRATATIISRLHQVPFPPSQLTLLGLKSMFAVLYINHMNNKKKVCTLHLY